MEEKFFSTKKLCYVALFTALNVVLSSFGVPVPGGKIYLNDIVICIAAIVLDPLSAFIVGGVGAFLGDAIFYPAPMWVSLVTRGVQAVAISLIVGKKDDLPVLWRSIVAVAVGAVINVLGYTYGKIWFYSTYEYAMIKLPFQIVQAVVCAAVALVLLYATPIKRLVKKVPKE